MLNAAFAVTATALICAAVLALAINAGRADHRPYVLPNGAVVHGDWGLYRPGHVVPWIEGPVVVTAPRYGFGAYFPTNRYDAGAYRRRPPVDKTPIPAEPYYRSWGTRSESCYPDCATIYAPFEPPAVIYAPKSHSLKN
jgi:hypothetical protein